MNGRTTRYLSIARRLALPAAVLLAAGLALTAGPAAARTPSPSGITVSVAASGEYQIRAAEPAAWRFGGTVGHPVTGSRDRAGSDAIGRYREVDFTYTDTVARTARIRVYQNKPIVLFGSTNVGATTNAGTTFPALRTPALPYRESFRDGAFAPYVFNGSVAPDSPLLAFDGQGRGFLISPADNFAVADLARSSVGTVSEGIVPGVATLPAGFTHSTMLVLGGGVNELYATWGSALMALGGKHPVPNDTNVTLDKLGYWTDNGATYYYNYDNSLGYTGTLEAATKDFAAHGIPLGYLQLDSWWYPKGSSDTWQGNGINRGGEYTYRAAPALFPDGLASFQRQLGLPLVTHARWIDPASPYHQQYTMSGNVVTDPSFWRGTMSYLAGSGVRTYEQDWLSNGAQTVLNLTDPDAFTGNMARAAASDNITVQYCMPLPWNYLDSTRYQNVQTSRVSGDRFNRANWDGFLFNSRLAGALGEWPWTDVFMNTETDNLLLSTLSGGMVGVGDAIGTESAANLAQTVRADGVIVKPDAPIVPVDSVYPAVAQHADAPMVASTYTDHHGLREAYVFGYARNGGSEQIGFRPSEVGVNGAAYVYNYFTGAGTLVPAGGRFTDTVSSGSYYVVAPVGRSGIAFLGDAGKFVSTGSKRISALADDGTVRATVAFAIGEKSVTLHGYAPTAPVASAAGGTAGPVHYDANTRQFSVTVTPGVNRAVAVTLAD